MQSVPITTKIVSLITVHSEVYSIQHYVIKFPFSSSQVKLIYPILKLDDLVWFMVLKVTFNNISVIAWRYVLLVEETVGCVLPQNKYNYLMNTSKYQELFLRVHFVTFEGEEFTR
jgi:hypothetical protein